MPASKLAGTGTQHISTKIEITKCWRQIDRQMETRSESNLVFMFFSVPAFQVEGTCRLTVSTCSAKEHCRCMWKHIEYTRLEMTLVNLLHCRYCCDVWSLQELQTLWDFWKSNVYHNVGTDTTQKLAIIIIPIQTNKSAWWCLFLMHILHHLLKNENYQATTLILWCLLRASQRFWRSPIPSQGSWEGRHAKNMTLRRRMMQTIDWKISRCTAYGAGMKCCSRSCNNRDVRVAAPLPILTFQVICAVHEHCEIISS